MVPRLDRNTAFAGAIATALRSSSSASCRFPVCANRNPLSACVSACPACGTSEASSAAPFLAKSKHTAQTMLRRKRVNPTPRRRSVLEPCTQFFQAREFASHHGCWRIRFLFRSKPKDRNQKRLGPLLYVAHHSSDAVDFHERLAGQSSNRYGRARRTAVRKVRLKHRIHSIVIV